MTNLDQITDNKSDNSFRLIVHIGMGKTGTSSIQKALYLQRKNLIDQGIWYLGVMLEHAPIRRYSWQKGYGIGELMSLPESEITAQLTDILSTSAEIIMNSGGNTAIVSNESLFDRPVLIHAFEHLAAKGWKIEIIAYIRRHDAWLRSAYIQWGINHKTYEGPLLPFSKWINQCFFFFNSHLRQWMNAKDYKMIVHNFDTVVDVVEDFYVTMGIPQQEIDEIKDNQYPSPEELLLRSLFNNQIQSTAFPDEFDRLMDVTKLDFTHSATTFLSHYLPTNEELMKIIDDCAEDRAEINRILNDNGQPSLDTSPLKSKPIEVDLAKLTAIMFEILANQARKIDLLESKINVLTASDN